MTPYRLREAGALAGVSIETVRGWAARGIIPARNPSGRMWLIPRAAFEAWLSSGDGEATDAGRGRAVKQHRHSNPEWADEVVRRWHRRKYRVQQREAAVAKLVAIIDASFVGRFTRWLAEALRRVG